MSSTTGLARVASIQFSQSVGRRVGYRSQPVGSCYIYILLAVDMDQDMEAPSTSRRCFDEIKPFTTFQVSPSHLPHSDAAAYSSSCSCYCLWLNVHRHGSCSSGPMASIAERERERERERESTVSDRLIRVKHLSLMFDNAHVAYSILFDSIL